VAAKQTEYEWVYLFATVNPLTGASSAMLAPYVDMQYMNEHLTFISREAGKDVQVVLVLDQAGWHTAKALKVPRNITLLHLPSKSPELNLVERMWRYLRGNYLSNRAYDDYDHLFEVTRNAWNRLTPETLASITATDWLRRAG
jgi:transposase